MVRAQHVSRGLVSVLFHGVTLGEGLSLLLPDGAEQACQARRRGKCRQPLSGPLVVVRHLLCFQLSCRSEIL